MPESRDVVERCVRLGEGKGQGFREDFQRQSEWGPTRCQESC